MITSEALKEMSLGDSFNMGVMFPGLCKDEVVWDVIEKGADYIICTVSMFGTLMGSYKLTADSAKIISKEE